MIGSFGNQGTEDIFNGRETKASLRVCPDSIKKIAVRKLDMLEAAFVLSDLRIPPGNQLEKLKGNLKNLYSIRINDQFRITFTWQNDQAMAVKIVDYHK